MKVEITEAEANELIRLIDEAVKSKGLSIAQNGLYFMQKLQDAAKEEKKNGSSNES